MWLQERVRFSLSFLFQKKIHILILIAMPDMYQILSDITITFLIRDDTSVEESLTSAAHQTY